MITWKKAIILLVKDKVEVVSSHDRVIHGVSISLKLPSVLRLLSHVRVARQGHQVPFSRANIYFRDKYQGQYCGQQLSGIELTFDHVVPVSQGGRKAWDNIVTCCVNCNRQKGGKTPRQAGLTLLRRPRRLSFLPALHITLGMGDVPAAWDDYLYWGKGSLA